MKMRIRRKRSAIIARHGAVVREMECAHDWVGIDVARALMRLAEAWRDVARKFVADMKEMANALPQYIGGETRRGMGH